MVTAFEKRKRKDEWLERLKKEQPPIREKKKSAIEKTIRTAEKRRWNELKKEKEITVAHLESEPIEQRETTANQRPLR